MGHLVGVGLDKGRAGGGTGDIGPAGRVVCQAVEAAHQAQYVGHEDIGDAKGIGEPFAAGECSFHLLETGGEESIQVLPARGLLVIAGEVIEGPGQAGGFHGVEGGEQPADDRAAGVRVGGHQRFTALCQMQEDGTAFEQREIVIGEPGHLPEGLMCKVIGSPFVKRNTLHPVRQPGLFQRPTHAQVTHVAPWHVGHPVIGGKDKIRHRALPRVSLFPRP